MVRWVCTSDDVKHNRMYRQLSPSSRMTTKSKGSFGLWRSMDYVFALLLLLQCSSAPAATLNSTTVTTAKMTTAAEAISTNRSTATQTNRTTTAATTISTNTSTTTQTNETTTAAATSTNTSTGTQTNGTATTATISTYTSTATQTNGTATISTNTSTATQTNGTESTAENTTTSATLTTKHNVTTTAENFTNATTLAITTIPVNATIFNTSRNVAEMLSTHYTPSAFPTTPMPCSFNLSCNQTFYWMAISVQSENQSLDFQEWFRSVFQSTLSKCVDADNSSVSNTSNASTRTPDPFLDMKVSCETRPVATEALFEVLLKLSRPVDVCCIQKTLKDAGNSTTNVTLIGDVERVGVCLDNTTSNSSGLFNKCNNSSNSDPQCSGNLTCGNNTDTFQKNCTIIPQACYRLTVDNVTMNTSTFMSTLDQCIKNTSYQPIYLGTCNTMLPTDCTVIVRGRVFDVCPVSFEDFCRNKSLNSLVNCFNGSTVVVLQNDSCNANVTDINGTFPTPSSTSPPPSTASTNPDAGELLNMTANPSSLTSSEVDAIITKLERLLSGPNVSVALANTSVGVVNYLLDVPVAVMAPFSKRANGIVDTVGLKLVLSGESEILFTSSLALAVKKVNGAKFQETSFSITDPSNVQIHSDSRLKRDVQVRSVPLGSAILPASLTQNLSSQEQELASRVQFNFYNKSTFFQDKALGERRLISGILSASVANLNISNLQKNVTITLQNTETPGNKTEKVLCAFWDLGLNGGTGGWSSEGCTKVNSSSSEQETQCSCNHLTSFGILLDLSQQPIDPLQNTILTYITFIGCGISSIFLSITLLTYLAFSKLRNDIPSKILIQLCLALLLLNLVFLVDGWLTQFPEVKGLCISTAFFLHYFLLASFTWMAMEAVHMYIALVKVFNTYISRFMLKIGFVGWGIPLIVVIVVIATNNIPTTQNYGIVSYGKFVDGTPDQFCWITNDTVFYVAVVGYFCIVFLINFTMFIVVLVQLCRIKRQNPQNVQHRSSWQEIRSVAGLSVLLGLTWGFAFFAWGPVNLPFMYLFAIFNSSQGLFIFIYHCALKENVRRQWRTYLCCGKLRLPENSEWSHTATQKIKKAPKKRPSTAHSNYSSSSFLNNDSTSDLPVGISNPYDDRIIKASEKSNSDVVLNETNNKHRGKKSY